jgi:hypothetical protein
MGSDIFTTIDDTLTFHSAALGEDLAVAVERERGVSLDDLDAGLQIITNAIANWARTFDEFGRQFAAAWKAMQPALRGAVAAVALIQKYDAARRARLRRMHHLYRMRRRPW